VGGVNRAAAGFTNAVSRAPYALHGRRDRERGLDENHAVEIADVDAELQRACRDDRPQFAFLELVLDLQAKFARERSMV